jgi:DNA (cytosine-5)-methyltransferase 1
MRRVRSRDTQPELALRRALWSRGVRFRLGHRDLPGRPDLVFTKKRVALFVDGDYWHGNQWSVRGHTSLHDQMAHVHRRDYWVKKIFRNIERDYQVTAKLLSDRWTVLRFWETDVHTRLEECVQLTMNALAGERGPEWSSRLPELSFAEFFAGIGLVRLALERAGWHSAFANDIDAEKRQIYVRHFSQDPQGHLWPDDIHALPTAVVPAVSLATASFPCNDLSVAGARNGLAGRQSGTFWAFIRILREMADRRPALVLLENVVGFLTSHGGNDFRDALLALNELGYVCDAFIVDAANFVPQSRQRLFVIGMAAVPEAERKTPLLLVESDTRPKQLVEYIRSHPEIRWHVRPLPSLPVRQISLVDILENLPDDDPAWWRQDRCSYLLSQMSERHAKVAHKMIETPSLSYGTVFRRVRAGRSMAELRVDGIAGCLRTPRGGSGRQILFVAGHGTYRCRLLTARECARLQGAPESFPTDFPLNQSLFGFGDAVCVPVIEWIARNYLNRVVTALIRNRIMSPPVSAKESCA